MELDLYAEFPLEEMTQSHRDLRESYTKALQRKPTGLFYNHKFAVGIQEKLNLKLSKQIEPNE